MSRIYEALQRAEAERAAGLEPDQLEELEIDRIEPSAPPVMPESAWQEPDGLLFGLQREPYAAFEPLAAAPIAAEVSPSRSVSAPVLPAAVLPAAVLPAAVLPGTPPSEQLSAGPAAATAPSTDQIDIDSIANAPWTPVLEHLPAVRERGRTVEQFRSLRSRLQEFRSANRTKSILVTSGLPQEGKSFVAVNLAISLARHKISRVLLIDGDMRRSSLHKVLGCPNDGPGLTEYLSGQATLQEILRRPEPHPDGAPLPLGFASLIFIGAGKEADKAADLSGNHRFEELIATVGPLFDWVIVDSSPVNLVSDGVNLARACDGVLLIARGEVTKFETAQQAVAALEAAKILGVVLNAVDNSFASGGYYDYDSTAEKGDLPALPRNA